MGQFSVQATIAHPSVPVRSAEVELVVDTGATLSWVARGMGFAVGPIDRRLLPRTLLAM